MLVGFSPSAGANRYTAALLAGPAIIGANFGSLVGDNAIGVGYLDPFAAQYRFRPDNDGSTVVFTRNWTSGSDKKIPWPVKEIVAAAPAVVVRTPARAWFRGGILKLLRGL